MNLTFLSLDKIVGKKQLEIFKIRGTNAAITDFAILSGGFVSNGHWINDDHSLGNRTGYYWTKTYNKEGNALVIDEFGMFDNNYNFRRTGGGRPAFNYSNLYSISKELTTNTSKDGVIEAEYGHYPQTAVNLDTQIKLERAYKEKNLIKTNKTYITDSRKYDETNVGFSPQIHKEYEFEGKRYVRVIANSCFVYEGTPFKLSNNQQYCNGDAIWIQVEPVKWLVDEKSKTMITEKIIFAGIQFDIRNVYKNKFDNTNIKNFMDNFFINDLLQYNDKDKDLSNINKFEKIIKEMSTIQKKAIASSLLQDDQIKNEVIKNYLLKLDGELGTIFEEISKIEISKTKILKK